MSISLFAAFLAATAALMLIPGPNVALIVANSLRFGVRVGEQAFQFDSGSEAEGPSPVQALQAALGGCTAMDVISILRKVMQAQTNLDADGLPVPVKE